jgi:hypothetical protein
MKKIAGFFAILLLLAQTHCSLRKEKLDKLWVYTYSNESDRSKDTLATRPSFIDLQPDKTYTLDLGGFDSGHWEWRDSFLVLRSINGYIATIPIKYQEHELKFGVDTTILHFENKPRKFSTPADNPFSIENNQWRIHAAKKENDQELKNHLINHFKFYELYFKWALDNDIKNANVYYTPSPVRIYGNRLMLREPDNLPEMWRTSFYDNASCLKAYDMLKNIFDNKDIAWLQTDNNYKKFIYAFQQLQNLLK